MELSRYFDQDDIIENLPQNFKKPRKASSYKRDLSYKCYHLRTFDSVMSSILSFILKCTQSK